MLETSSFQPRRSEYIHLSVAGAPKNKKESPFEVRSTNVKKQLSTYDKIIIIISRFCLACSADLLLAAIDW